MMIEELDRLIAVAAFSPFQRRLAAGYAHVLATDMVHRGHLTVDQYGDAVCTIIAICPSHDGHIELING